MNRDAGFTLVELLIATAVTVAIVGAVLALTAPAHSMQKVQPEVSDLQQRLRVAVEAMRRDLLIAGAGTTHGTHTASLFSALAPVMPYRAGEMRPDPASGVYYRPEAMTVVYIPPTSAQAGVDNGTPYGSSELHVEARFNCGPLTHTDLCGFREGAHAVVFDASGIWDAMTVTRVAGPALDLRHRRSRAPASYGADAVVAHVEMHTYYLSVDTRAGTYQLRHYDGFASDMPMVDDVVALEFEYFGDPDPPRLRADRVTTYGPRPPAADTDRLTDTWPVGENCTFALVDGEHVPRLPVLAADRQTPVLLAPAILQDGPWCPAPEDSERFDADLLRIRRVRVRLRVQVASAVLRGPAGLLFARSGSATAGHALVPDQEIRFDVTPRNMAAGR